MHLFFTPENIHVHLPVQRAEALQMTYDLLDDPTVRCLYALSLACRLTLRSLEHLHAYHAHDMLRHD